MRERGAKNDAECLAWASGNVVAICCDVGDVGKTGLVVVKF